MFCSGVSTTEGEHWESQRNFFHNYLVQLVNGSGAKGFHEVIMDEILDMKREFSAKVCIFDKKIFFSILIIAIK